MTLREFVVTLQSTKRFGTNMATLVIDIFRAAGSSAIPSESAVKSWVSKKPNKNCQTSRYFPENSIDEYETIKYFKRWSSAVWTDIQEAFCNQYEASSADREFCIDLTTENADIFYWSLLNQLQRILRLPVTGRDEQASVQTDTVLSPVPLTAGKIRDVFLNAATFHRVMDIINKQPAVYNRTDTAELSTFLDVVNPLFLNPDKYSHIDDYLYALIRSFIESLTVRTLSIEATLNNRFSFEYEQASINMDDEVESSYRSDIPTLPEAMSELANDSTDRLHLYKLEVKEWANFRNEMNLVFDKISSWNDRELQP